MTTIIDGKTLNVEGGGLEDDVKPVGSFVDQWENESYGKRAKIIGAIRSWALKCYEENVAWTVSAAKHLKEKVAVGDAVSFSLDEGNLHVVAATNVYILGVNVTYKKGAKPSSFVRYFTLKLQEAPL